VTGENSYIGATGMMSANSKELLLMTNKHNIIMNDTLLANSILLFLNRNLANGDIISGPEYREVALVRGDTNYFELSDSNNIDIVIIRITPHNCRFTKSDIEAITKLSPILIKSSTHNIDSVKNCDIATAIGYPSRDTLLNARTPEINWGYLIDMDSTRVRLHMPIYYGNSGSPVFLRKNNKYSFLGLIYGMTNKGDTAFAVPGYKIYEEFEYLFDK